MESRVGYVFQCLLPGRTMKVASFDEVEINLFESLRFKQSRVGQMVSH